MNATPEPDVRMFDNGETRSTENATVVTDEKRDLTHPSPPPDYSSDSAVTLCQSLEFKDRDLDPWAGKSRCVTVADPESGDGDDYQYPGGVRLALLFSSLCMTLSLVLLRTSARWKSDLDVDCCRLRLTRPLSVSYSDTSEFYLQKLIVK